MCNASLAVVRPDTEARPLPDLIVIHLEDYAPAEAGTPRVQRAELLGQAVTALAQLRDEEIESVIISLSSWLDRPDLVFHRQLGP